MVVNFEVRDGELEVYNPVNPTALQTINKKINETNIDSLLVTEDDDDCNDDNLKFDFD